MSVVLPLGKWMTVQEVAQPGRKTKAWEVFGSDNSNLGAIEWCAPWRQYAFSCASYDVVLNKGCLRDLADFCERKTTERATERGAVAQRTEQRTPKAMADGSSPSSPTEPL